MALMKAAQLWEKFILKDLTTFARYAKVELTPPGPGEIGGIFRGAGNLVKDAATFKWTQVGRENIVFHAKLNICRLSGLDEASCC